MDTQLSDFSESVESQVMDYYTHAKIWFNKKYKQHRINKSFNFEDEFWYLPKSYSNNTYIRLSFSNMNSVNSRYDMYLVKSFIAGLLLDDYDISTASDYLSLINSLYNSSQHFKRIKIMSDSEILRYVEKNDQNYLYMIIEYFDFVIDNNFIDTSNTYYLDAREKLSHLYLKKSFNVPKIRTIPPNVDIAMFQYYLHRFERMEKDENLIKLFFSLRIWWHLSTIIPIRPSEITFMLNRNCVFELNNRYYIRINRIKSGLIKRNNIPILRKICIDSKLYNLICSYQNYIESDSETKSLFSIKLIRQSVINLSKYNKFFKYKQQIFHKDYENYNRFEAGDMSKLINLFYDYYIDTVYKEKRNYIRLKCGDTRHLAFSSLLLQNVNPIDIAMIGGHTSLQSLSPYVSHVDLYMDSEAYKYSKVIKYDDQHLYRELKDIIFSMPEAGNNIENAYPDEMGIGYCTSRLCECEDDLCFFCSHWWCRNSKSSYIKSIKYLMEYYKKHLDKDMEYNKQMLEVLFSKMRPEFIDDQIILPDEYYMKYQEIIKKITSISERRENIKQSLLMNFSKEDIDE
ncbi:hypothetical protein lbkm_1102 [Lachnospiraceae bacterium KM106-2]|nr:hypothetical protein lbkm_1102 [Lachnospiraceae bacterium KM106-2]